MERFDTERKPKNRKQLTMKKIILAVVATVFVAVQAYAITGTIGFSGGTTSGMTQKTSGGTTTNHFNNPWQVIAGSHSGDYATIPDSFSPVTMSDFSFTGNNAAAGGQNCTTCPVIQWSFVFGGKTYTFELDQVTSASNVAGSIGETGTGIACIDSNCSPGTWSLNGSKSANSFTFNASVHTSAVPDGGSAVALLGIALAGIEAGRRLLRARKA
jgi:hypothetical protein